MTARIDRIDFPDESNAQLIKDMILDELGQYVFDQLCDALGGQTIDLPARPDTIHEGHFLAQAVGLENARLLVKTVGFAHYYVPMPNHGSAPGSDPVELVRKGLATWEIAKVIGFTERHVRRLLASRGVRNHNRKPRSLPALLGAPSGGGTPVQTGGFA